jgi:aminoglycoside phosphotransferase (APT) family kinase protein
MDLERVTASVERHVRDRADAYGLDARQVSARPSLSLGGFVNVHVQVGDGRRWYHLKLARDPEQSHQLRRWLRLAPLLESRYRAPRVVDWIELAGTPFEGLLFERIDGQPLDLLASPSRATSVVELLCRLHDDAELERTLGAEGDRGDGRASVLEHYVECLEADLAESGDRYPVLPETVAWMRQETSRLRALIEAEPSFDQVRTVPVHGDLWSDNILVEPTGTWRVLDWDGLSLGDPVLDYALLLWPLARAGSDPAGFLGARATDPSFMARFGICLRANLLDEVIDSLADWVEVEDEAAPDEVDRIRAIKLETHRRAMADYARRHR